MFKTTKTDVTQAEFVPLVQPHWRPLSFVNGQRATGSPFWGKVFSNDHSLLFNHRSLRQLPLDHHPFHLDRRQKHQVRSRNLIHSGTHSKILGSLSMQRFWVTDGDWKCTVFLFYLSSHYHIYIFKALSLCASRDDHFENLGETNVLACKMFTSRPWLKNVACLSSLLVSIPRYFPR